jgi:outer membrane immunogenic protein
MRKSTILVAAAAAAALSAAPAAALPSGFYVGVHAGWDFGDTATNTTVAAGTYFAGSSVTSINANSPTNLDEDGFNGGAQLGWLWTGGGWGWGVEGDFSYMGRNESASVTVPYPCCAGTSYTSAQAMDRDWLATLRARLGFDVGGAFVYATGGAAFGDVGYAASFSDTFTPIPTQTFSRDGTEVGWTVGGGLEFGLGATTSAKIEYLYVDLGSVGVAGTLPGSGGTTAPLSSSASFVQHVARIGLNLHF